MLQIIRNRFYNFISGIKKIAKHQSKKLTKENYDEALQLQLAARHHETNVLGDKKKEKSIIPLRKITDNK